MPGDWEWLMSRNAARSAMRAEARRAKGLLPWGAKTRARAINAPSASCASANLSRKRLRCKTAPADIQECARQSAPPDILERAPQSAPADAQERASQLAPAGTHADAAPPSDKFGVGNDPDDAKLWAFIDEDMRREREAWLDEQEQLLLVKERALWAREKEIEEREREVAARERKILQETVMSRPNPCINERCGNDAVRRLLAR